MRLSTRKTWILSAVTALVITGFAGEAGAAEVYLQAQRFTQAEGATPMWGFASCTDATFSSCDPAAAPGTQISATVGETLTIRLRNTLEIPVSITIPGQTGEIGRAPTMMTGAPDRVRSFTHETGPGADGTYIWENLAEGTYLYQSGTFPSLQVPMGLYGALVVSDGAGNAYGHAVDGETVLLLSEIDPVQNSRVDAAAAASMQPGIACEQDPTVTGYPCAVDYNPMYFLVNGAATATLPAGDPTTASVHLLRFLNAGLRSHTPSIVGIDLNLIAEDGNAYPGLPRAQSAALLAAGKTLDALITLPAGDQTYSLFDRMPTFSNESLPNGGSLVSLQVGAGAPDVPPPASPAVDDTYDVVEDTVTTVPADGVLSNDPGLSGATMVSGVSHGSIECAGTGVAGICADGSFTYTPNQDYSGSDTFSYSASDGTNSYGATVTLNVSFVNDDPVAGDDSFTNNIGTTISVAAPGVLGNDADADGDALTAAVVGALPAGTLTCADPDDSNFGSSGICANGSFEYTGTVGTATFSYTASDAGAVPSTATVTLNINPVADLTLIVKEPGATGAVVPAYRWTIEEDRTFHPDPANPNAESQATTFHTSYMPVVAQGCVGEGACSEGEEATSVADVALDPTKHYYVSVLPADAVAETNIGTEPVFVPYRMGHTIGGAQIPPAAERTNNTVTVITNKEPLPYAQISIFIFDDSSPTNGAVDLNEVGLGGFQVTLEDAGGRYGASAGQMLQDADGNGLTNALDCFGGAAQAPGVILSCPDTPANREAGLVGRVLIKNLAPGKYGVITTPRANDELSPGVSKQWVQTSTIEGSKVIDAWVKAGEPPFFTEFGPVGVHVFVGFVSPEATEAIRPSLPAALGTTTITGAITNHHMSRPPNQTLWGVEEGNTYEALAHTRPWVGLNTAGGRGRNIAAVQATMNEDGTATFEIPNVPLGADYQIVVWDSFLDQVIAYRSVSAAQLATNPAVGNIPVFQWFARLENHVFLDENGNGMRDGNEAPIPEQAVNLRWRDGTLYQSFPTDLEGFVPFDQVFPFFAWLVAEVDYARFEATGLTVTVDHGGDTRSYNNVLNPQIQLEDCTTGTSCMSRTETGQVLTQGFQGFLGQTSVFEWGKRPYEPGTNGGISGIVYYGVTRAEADPRLAAAEPWEPGIAGVTVRLYREVNTAEGGTALALVQETTTDSWDDSLPTGCPGAHEDDHLIVGYDEGQSEGDVTTKCYDGLRNFNQARPAVFDGGYAFNDIPAGVYVVEVVVPPGYELMKEEDVNVGFGDGYAAESIILPDGAVPIVPDAAMVAEAGAEADAGLAQPVCVGEDRVVPLEMSLFPQANEQAPFAGSVRPLCDRKRVILSDQGQAAADFTLMTDAPIAAHFSGMVLDDVAQEFNPLSPQFGEKWAPPFVPVSIRDYKGEEISRVYSDQWGRINGLMPSTFTANMPTPSGFSPAMHMTCMNDPGPILDTDPASPTNGQLIQDPQYNPAYSNFCYTFQYMPGATTYLDTPVLPVSAFASGYNPPDCALDAGTPMIFQVDGTGAGPLVAATGDETLTIRSVGTATVPNPAYEGPIATPTLEKTITRDFGFGDVQGLGTVTIGGVELTNISWSNEVITGTVPVGTTTGQLVVTRDNGNSTISTENSITVTIGTEASENVVRVASGGYIQAAIDAAQPGALILVAPGVYNESVIMWKPVRLQGAGAGSTMINAVKRPTEVLLNWRAKMDSLFDAGLVDSLPNQADGAAGFSVSEGAAITVLGPADPAAANSFSSFASRIDGFSITGADVGGGVLVNSNAHNLEIANNSVHGNYGSFHGGVRIGAPFLQLAETGPYGFNTDVSIHNNAITNNGGLGGAGGGISIASGSDGYNISSNFVCGNFTTGDGGGIGHLGLSDGGAIVNNRVEFNQSFNQAVTVSGGGVFIGGEPKLVDLIELEPVDLLTFGSGDVQVRGNHIRGNHAAAGHGGGIRTQFVNGQDVADANNTNQWHRIRIIDNVIFNNVAGWSGGGVSLQDTARSEIKFNTIAHNDSTATVGGLIGHRAGVPAPNQSDNQPAGISTELHSAALAAVIPIDDDGDPEFSSFSNPDMATGNGRNRIPQTNILWENRSFYYDAVDGTSKLMPVLSQTEVGECVAGAAFWDLDTLLGGGLNEPTADDPAFAGTTYCNGGRTLLTEPGQMFPLPALDEGGNAWIDVRYGPLTRAWPEGAAPWAYE